MTHKRVRRRSTRLETFVGRSAAICVHPYAAWRTQPNRTRVLLFFTYAAASYIVMLTLLQVL